MSALECGGVSAGYDGVPVIRDITLHVESGEVVALLGPNGAGKTTLLLTISGLLRPISRSVDSGPASAGVITLHGEQISSMLPERIARRGLGHVPDDRALFGELSVTDNLRLASRPGWFSIEDAFEMFPALRKRENVDAQRISGGEQQMLALCRALVQNPSVLIVDEMSLGLAPTVVQTLMPVLRQIADDHDVAVLMVEQHVHMAIAIADRAYVLNHGEMVLDQEAETLRRKPEMLEAAYLSGGV